MTTPYQTSGPEKSKGYWQAIANYEYAMHKFIEYTIDTLPPEEGLEIMELGEQHPVYGEFFERLADITVVISDTYGVSMDEVQTDLDTMNEAHEFLLEVADWMEDFM